MKKKRNKILKGTYAKVNRRQTEKQHPEQSTIPTMQTYIVSTFLEDPEHDKNKTRPTHPKEQSKKIKSKKQTVDIWQTAG